MIQSKSSRASKVVHRDSVSMVPEGDTINDRITLKGSMGFHRLGIPRVVRSRSFEMR
jgi:hypothetical protein